MQGTVNPMGSTLALRIPAGILDCTPLPVFDKLRHSFESGCRHLTIDANLTTEDEGTLCRGCEPRSFARALCVQPFDYCSSPCACSSSKYWFHRIYPRAGNRGRAGTDPPEQATYCAHHVRRQRAPHRLQSNDETDRARPESGMVFFYRAMARGRQAPRCALPDASEGCRSSCTTRPIPATTMSSLPFCEASNS